MKAAALIGALTVSLHTLFLFSLTFPAARTHHVIFEEIGEMAGALSYIHVVVPVNISGLLQAVNAFRNKIVVLKTNYADTSSYAKRLQDHGGANTNNPTKHVLVHFRRQLSGLMDLMIKDADILRNAITSLKTSLPRVDKTARDKRSVGLIIRLTVLSGVFGTLMGWFTHRRLNNLRDQISEVRNEQHRLLQIQQVSLAQIDTLKKVLSKVIIEMERQCNTWVNYFALDHARIQLHFHLQKLVRSLQVAHLCRLSVDLLDDRSKSHLHLALLSDASKRSCAHIRLLTASGFRHQTLRVGLR